MTHAVLPVEQVRALVRLLFPEHMTPIAKRQIESACEAAEMQAERPRCPLHGDGLSCPPDHPRLPPSMLRPVQLDWDDD